MAFTIGVDIGGTNILAGVVGESGEIVATTRRATDASDPAQIEVLVAEAVRQLMAGRDVEGVGVAAARLRLLGSAQAVVRAEHRLA